MYFFKNSEGTWVLGKTIYSFCLEGYTSLIIHSPESVSFANSVDKPLVTLDIVNTKKNELDEYYTDLSEFILIAQDFFVKASGDGGVTDNKSRTIAKPINGFENHIDVIASFNDSTRTLQLSPSSTSFEFWTNGVQYSKASSDSIAIDDIEGNWYVYYDGLTLQKTQVFNPELITKYAFVAVLYWDAANKKQIYFGREYRHGTDMAGSTHARLHNIVGFDLEPGGGNLTDMNVDSSGNNISSIQFGNDITEAWDEDAYFNHSARLSTDIIPIYYFDGPNLRILETNNYPVLNSGSGRASYNNIVNGSGSIVEVSNRDFVLSHIFTTNDIDRPYGCFVGQNEYDNRGDARDGAEVEIQSLFTFGIPLAEIKFLGTQIIETRNSYNNAAKSIFRSTNDGGDYIDLRTTLAGKGGDSPTTFNHNSSAGLQGGILNQYYHLTEAELLNLNNQSGTNTGDQDLSGLALKSDVLGYILATWGANLQTLGYHPAQNGPADGPQIQSLGISASAQVPAAGTIDAITYYNTTADNTTTFQIIKNSLVMHTFTCIGPYGVETNIGLPTGFTGSVADNIAIRYVSGTAPGPGFYSMYIK